jgi:leucyl aminopeptidase
MELKVFDPKRALARVECLAVLATKGETIALPRGVEIHGAAKKDFKGEFREIRTTDALAGPARRVALVGLGKESDVGTERLRRASALAARCALSAKAASLVIAASARAARAAKSAFDLGQSLAEGALMATYSAGRYKSKKDERKLRRIALLGRGRDFSSGVARGRTLAEANLFARDLQNAPANLMRPRDMVAEARKLAKLSRRMRLRVLDERAMERLGMGALLSVSKGSEEPAFLIHLTYQPRARAKGKIALVGKGITFDSGGISIKPAAKMDEMKFDMSGGAAVLGGFKALAHLDVPFEIHGLVPTSENLLDGRASKPGDLVTAMNGTTIEVLNTDAEGRLILCDALSYAVERVKPDTIIDLATLTGAVVVALGHELSGVMGNSEKLCDALIRAGEEVGEPCWRLPLLDTHKDQMKSKLGDLKNVNAGEGNGSSAGAAFLSFFVGDTAWAHLDIAGTAWGGIDRDYVGGPAGSGVGVRLLLEYLESRR